MGSTCCSMTTSRFGRKTKRESAHSRRRAVSKSGRGTRSPTARPLTASASCATSPTACAGRAVSESPCAAGTACSASARSARCPKYTAPSASTPSSSTSIWTRRARSFPNSGGRRPTALPRWPRGSGVKRAGTSSLPPTSLLSMHATPGTRTGNTAGANSARSFTPRTQTPTAGSMKSSTRRPRSILRRRAKAWNAHWKPSPARPPLKHCSFLKAPTSPSPTPGLPRCSKPSARNTAGNSMSCTAA